MSPNRGAPAGAAVRAAAALLVAQVVDERASVEDLLAKAEIEERDRPLLGALVFAAVRWHERLAWQAARLLSRPLKPGQSQLAALLRVGLVQLQELRIPAHAAVSTTVDAAALLGQRSAGALVNAVLRRYQRERERLAAEQERFPVARFAHPAWLIEAVQSDYPADWPSLLDANNAPAPMWLRVNLTRTGRASYVDELEAAGYAATAAEHVDSAICLDEPVAVEQLPGFVDGVVSVQDVSAQRAVEFLDLAPGQRVLDACAAPGGKTGHILEVVAGQGEVWAVDRDAARLQLVADNLARLKLAAKLVAGDATVPRAWWDGRPFDRILVDAPCSAIGVIRRHPDIKLRRSLTDVERVVKLQADMLRALWPLLAPGGRLVYATCTVLKRENDAQIAAFLGAERTAVAGGCLQLTPGEARGDGFYYAWLRKPHLSRTTSGSSSQP